MSESHTSMSHLTGTVEVRQEGETPVLHGSFPFRSPTLIRKNGRIVREHFEPGSLVQDEKRGVDLLLAHDSNRPIASTRNGNLSITTDEEGISFEYRAEGDLTSWAADAIKAVGQGIMTGLSPGFVVQPGGDTYQENRSGIRDRIITKAILTELSIVGRPAYDQAAVAMRDESPGRVKFWL